jgi:hypothetical protein
MSVSAPKPSTNYLPPGAKPAWAAWWEGWNSWWNQVHAAAGTDPAGGLSDDERIATAGQQE